MLVTYEYKLVFIIIIKETIINVQIYYTTFLLYIRYVLSKSIAEFQEDYGQTQGTVC